MMTEDDARTVPITETDSIERGDATRPWSLNELTVNDLDNVTGMYKTLDTVFVPWGATEPVDKLEAVFTIETRVLDRRELELGSVLGEVASLIEGDRRLEDFVVFEHLAVEATVAEIDDARARVKLTWDVATEAGT